MNACRLLQVIGDESKEEICREGGGGIKEREGKERVERGRKGLVADLWCSLPHSSS